MAQTLTQLRDHARAVMGEDFDPRYSLDDVVNQSGRQLFSMHSWRWRLRSVKSLDLVEGEDSVPLPADFDELVAFESTTTSRQFSLTSIEEILERRSYALTDTFNYFGAVVSPSQVTEKGVPPVARMELWPAVQSGSTDAFRIAYRSAWVDLNDGDDVANVPPKFDLLLIKIVRAMAMYYVTNSMEEMELINQSSELATLKGSDGAQQANLGPIGGGVLNVHQPHNWVSTGIG